jgi:antitoxin HigA-1
MNNLLPLITPGEILAEEFLEPLNVSQNRLARDMDVPVSRISGIIKGDRAITGDTALRLAAFFGTTAEFWMNLQTDFELRSARREKGIEISSRVRPFAAKAA